MTINAADWSLQNKKRRGSCCPSIASRSFLNNYLMTPSSFENLSAFANRLDADDPMKGFRARFHIPQANSGGDAIYFTGNSLGLQPKTARSYVEQELDDWARLAVEGHIHAKNPWLPYHEFVTEPLARLVG